MVSCDEEGEGIQVGALLEDRPASNHGKLFSSRLSLHCYDGVTMPLMLVLELTAMHSRNKRKD